MNSYQAGRGQQKEATSSYNPYDDRQSKQSNKECWIVTPKPHQPGGKLRQASTTKHSSYQTSTEGHQPYPSLHIQASSAGQDRNRQTMPHLITQPSNMQNQHCISTLATQCRVHLTKLQKQHTEVSHGCPVNTKL
ncbi:hypothetical protein NC653_041366 [Populus alba x Populus x berolinensis]|uniref:Uncharacterized protein n=1 Tax=Populus alba x Populus x berolinensis TaxID=444605 RepID=A0AAD6L8E2_9ROSI|nr:hypothetical protein NC653_041366 [Populus alba x Populus x berolinensis]